MKRRPLDNEIAKARAAKAAADAKLAALLMEQARLVDEVTAEVHRESSLHNQHSGAKIIDTMEAESAVRGARLETKHPAALKIRKVDKSIARFAEKHGLTDTTVRSWYATGVAARKIPKKYVELLAKPPYSIPVTAWRNGVSE